jgi:hypothetical protein
MESLPNKLERDRPCNLVVKVADVVRRRDETPANDVVVLNETIASHVDVSCHKASRIHSSDQHQMCERESAYREDRQIVDAPKD